MRSPSRPPGLRLPSCHLGFTLGQNALFGNQTFSRSELSGRIKSDLIIHIIYSQEGFKYRKLRAHLSPSASFGPGCLKEPSNSFALFLFWRNDTGEWPGENWFFFFCLRILVWFSFPSWHTILLSDLLEEYWYSELGIGQPNNWFRKGEKRKRKITVLSLFFLEGSNQRQKRKQVGSGITNFPLRQRESLIDY